MIAQLIAFISMFVAVLGDGHGDWENHDSMVSGTSIISLSMTLIALCLFLLVNNLRN